MHVASKRFGKIYLKAIRDAFFLICGLWSREWWGDLIFCLGVYQIDGGNSDFLACRRSTPLLSHPLEGQPDFSIRITLRTVLGLLTVMVLKIVSESILFKNNKFTACEIKDGKEVANYLMMFNLLKIIRPFQGKKHLRT